MDRGRLFPRIVAEFRELGYALKYRLMDAADYGVARHRDRVMPGGVWGRRTPLNTPNPPTAPAGCPM